MGSRDPYACRDPGQGEFLGRPGPLREAGERPKGGPRRGPRSPRATHRPPRAILERFWTRRGACLTQLRPISAASSRQSSSPSSRGLGRATQDGPTEVQKKLSKKAFQKVFQATCRPDVQSTCPTSCSSRPATVERSIMIIIPETAHADRVLTWILRNYP